MRPVDVRCGGKRLSRNQSARVAQRQAPRTMAHDLDGMRQAACRHAGCRSRHGSRSRRVATLVADAAGNRRTPSRPNRGPLSTYARAKGELPQTQANPARSKGHLAHLLPKRQKLSRGHHAAMPWRDVPAFVARLRERETVAALALEFLI